MRYIYAHQYINVYIKLPDDEKNFRRFPSESIYIRRTLDLHIYTLYLRKYGGIYLHTYNNNDNNICSCVVIMRPIRCF